ncbi:Adenosylcobalamin-dependent ribonucleoside-triphosphate reductase [subsurface metagenome]
MTENSFSLVDLYPKYVINSKGEKKKFEVTNIAKVLNKETGLDMHIAEKVTEDVVRIIIGLGVDEITTNYIRELVCVELTQRGLNKYRNLFARAINLENISFTLDDNFIAKFIGKQPDWGPLGHITYKRTYARVVEGENRKEEFWETIKRVVEGCYSIQKEHCIKLSLPWTDAKAQNSAQIMYEKIWNFKFLPPGRGLWMMGTEFIARHGSMSLNNCGFASTDDINLKYSKAFQFVMDALMLGVGVGFDTKGAGKITIKKPIEDHFTFQLPDSREGWVESLKLIIEAYFLGKRIPKFDFSLIRPVGQPIRGFGGIASGPGPLMDMLKNIQEILKARIGQPIRSLDILDIMNLIGKCVVAGNVRRSAEIALGEATDLEFIKSKQDKEKLYSYRWASNNSIIAVKGLDYSFIADQIAVNGEPGILWLENAKAYSRMGDTPDHKDKKAAGVNPCGEQTLESFELCCLVETFPSRHESYEEYQDTLKYAYLYAKSVTLVNTHWQETNAVMLKNRRMGISQTGIIEAFVKYGRRTILDWCDNGYKYLRELDEDYSDWLCVPKSIKITTVKPSGTVSLLPGVTPGIHYPHSEYYIRRIRISKNSDLIEPIKNAGYHIEDDSYSPNTIVVEFPVHEQLFERSKDDVSIWEQAENAADYQKYWSDNQVSITITFKQGEANQIKHVLECFEDKLKSVSFLPIKEHGYKQAPYEEITKEKFEEMVSKLKPLDLDKTKDRAIGSKFCDSEACEIKL